MYLLYAAGASLAGLLVMAALYACKRFFRPGALLRGQLVDMLLISLLVGVLPLALGALGVFATRPLVEIAPLGLPLAAALLALSLAGLGLTARLFRLTMLLVKAESAPKASVTPLPPRPRTPVSPAPRMRRAA